jgi:hypothetical protein
MREALDTLDRSCSQPLMIEVVGSDDSSDARRVARCEHQHHRLEHIGSGGLLHAFIVADSRRYVERDVLVTVGEGDRAALR